MKQRMKQTNTNRSGFVWGLPAILMVLSIAMQLPSVLLDTESRLIGMAIGYSVVLIITQLIVKLFGKMKKEALHTPKWISILYTLIIAYGLSLFALFHSSTAYWVTVCALHPIICIYQLMLQTNRNNE